jgi:hypothetical protein
MCSPAYIYEASGSFMGEYFALRKLNRAFNWRGEVWQLENNMREIPAFSIEVVPWKRVSECPLPFWPPTRRIRIADPTDRKAGKPAKKDDGDVDGVDAPPLLDGPGGGGGGGEGGDDDDWDYVVIEELLDAHADLVGAGAGGGCGGDGHDDVEVDPPEGGGAMPVDPGVPPPPDPHPAPKGPGKGGGGKKYKRYSIWDGDGEECGYMIINANPNAMSFDAHCSRHRGDCSIGRTYQPYDGEGAMTEQRSAKGRPLAFLVAWLRMGARYASHDGDEDREKHMAAKRGDTAETLCLKDGRSPLRNACRDYVERSGHLADLRALERQPRDGEAIEPRGKF